MTKEEIFNGVQDIFRDIFDEDNMIIKNETSSDEIEEWDSLNHINLVSAIEKEFKIKFTLGELVGFKDVGAMVDLMSEKNQITMNTYKFEDIKVGLEESFNIKIESTMMDKFFDISSDNNPLHIDKDYAKDKGFLNRVVYGMLTSSFYSTLVGVYLPGKYCILQGIDIQFSKPVYINDDLMITGKVSYINEAYKQIEIKATIINQENKKVSKAIIKVGIMDE